MAKLLPVILCGGGGTRLWPVSRELRPKPFLYLTGERTLLQQTVLRARLACPDAEPILICHEDQRFVAAEQLRVLGAPGRIVLEPAPRNSGPAIAAAAEIVTRKDHDALLLVLPSDHQVTDAAAFAETVAAARAVAESGRIVTFGIAPTRAASEFGYILPGLPLGLGQARTVEAFVEKPDAERARRCVADGWLWNSGIFMFRARSLIDEFAALEPAIATAARRAVDELERGGDFERLGEVFRSSPEGSIDRAVMERTTQAAVVPVSFAWSDMGSWAALWESEIHDADGNVHIGPVVSLMTKNCYLRSDRLLAAVVGLENVVVVATDDAVLVATMNEVQRVRDLVAKLRERGRPEV